jgi:predicted phosphoribosyltransferase
MTAKIIEDQTHRERMFVFRDRLHAGKLLAEKIREYAGKENVILLALPAGGVSVGYAIAKELGILMDTMVVRKVQIPWNTEASCVVVDWHVREREDSVAVGFWRLVEQVFVFSHITHVRNENNG